LLPFAAFSHDGLEPLIKMNSVVFSPGIPVGFFLLLWTNDTGAYLVGSAIGKHRLFERISPKKSWEGFLGGLLLTLLVARLIGGWLGVADTTGWLIIAVIISIAGTAGDLLESMLKRSLELKDSGTILPGHGGFLDRFDSVVVSFPLVYLYIAISG
jgi:phosphatidate cytidylyltransferase